MASSQPKPSTRKRVRRAPEISEREILDATEALLAEAPFRELSIEAIMQRTHLRRPSFYLYFRDRYEVVARLLEDVSAQMFKAAEPWLEGTGDPVQDIRFGLAGIAQIYAEHGPVLAAIDSASHHDRNIERLYREEVLGGFIQAVGARLEYERRVGRIDVEDPVELGRALILMNVSYMVAALGRRPPDRSPKEVVQVLTRVWIRTLYGAD